MPEPWLPRHSPTLLASGVGTALGVTASAARSAEPVAACLGRLPILSPGEIGVA